MAQKHHKQRLTQRDKNRIRLVEYLSEPENSWPPRCEYAEKILGYKDHAQLYRNFTPTQLADIEAEAMENRKKRSARQRSALYQVLYAEGLQGNVTALKEFLDRTEGKVTEKHEHGGKGGSDAIKHQVVVEYVRPK